MRAILLLIRTRLQQMVSRSHISRSTKAGTASGTSTVTQSVLRASSTHTICEKRRCNKSCPRVLSPPPPPPPPPPARMRQALPRLDHTGATRCVLLAVESRPLGPLWQSSIRHRRSGVCRVLVPYLIHSARTRGSCRRLRGQRLVPVTGGWQYAKVKEGEGGC